MLLVVGRVMDTREKTVTPAEGDPFTVTSVGVRTGKTHVEWFDLARDFEGAVTEGHTVAAEVSVKPFARSDGSAVGARITGGYNLTAWRTHGQFSALPQGIYVVGEVVDNETPGALTLLVGKARMQPVTLDRNFGAVPDEGDEVALRVEVESAAVADGTANRPLRAKFRLVAVEDATDAAVQPSLSAAG